MIMVTEMVCISVKNLLHSAYHERRLYPLLSPLFEPIVGLPPEAASVFEGGRNLEDARSIARIGLIVLLEEIEVRWRMSFLSFDPWARAFVSRCRTNMHFRGEAAAKPDFDVNLVGFSALRLPDGNRGNLPSELEFDIVFATNGHFSSKIKHGYLTC